MMRRSSLFLAILVFFHKLLFQACVALVCRKVSVNPVSLRTRQTSPLRSASLTDFGITLSQTLEVPTPSYVQILQQGALLVTSFSMLRRGSITKFDLAHHSMAPHIGKHAQTATPVQDNSQHLVAGEYQWPNELASYTNRDGDKVLLVPDGFLMPGQDDGAIYAITNPDSAHSDAVRITKPKGGWFYHRAVHVVIPSADGVTPAVEGILTARAKKGLHSRGQGELLWLSIPENYQKHKYHYDQDLQNRHSHDAKKHRHHQLRQAHHPHQYWEETVLAKGPDVMFEVLDFDHSDSTIEVISAHFFGKKLSTHSLRHCQEFPFVEVAGSSSMHTSGTPYGICLASLTDSSPEVQQSNHSDGTCPAPVYCNNILHHESDHHAKPAPTHMLVTTHESSYDLASAVNMALTVMDGSYPRIKSGATGKKTGLCEDPASCRPGDLLLGTKDNQDKPVSGGSLYAYELPKVKKPDPAALFEESIRAEIATHPVPVRPRGHNHSGTGSHHAGHHLVQQALSRHRGPETGTTITAPRTRTGPVNSQDKRWTPGKSVVFKHTSYDDELRSFYEATDSIAQQDRQRRRRVNQIDTAGSIDTAGDAPPSAAEPCTATSAPIAQWARHTLCSGFRVKGWGGLFAPGAPGFPYAFHMPNKPNDPPLILVAGDCTGSAYLFAPKKAAPKLVHAQAHGQAEVGSEVPQYELLYEIECGATVGSAAVQPVLDGTGDVNLYVPAYELNKVHVFRLSDNGARISVS